MEINNFEFDRSGVAYSNAQYTSVYFAKSSFFGASVVFKSWDIPASPSRQFRADSQMVKWITPLAGGRRVTRHTLRVCVSSVSETASTAAQNQKAVTAYFTSKQLQSFGFAEPSKVRSSL